MTARRGVLVSAAQVALHYGGYNLRGALALSSDERDLLLAVAAHDEEEKFRRLGRMLGTTWDIASLIRVDTASDKRDQDKKSQSGPLPTSMEFPLSMMLAPEFMQNVGKTMRERYSRRLDLEREAGTSNIIELGSLPLEEAKAFWRGVPRAPPPKTK